MSVNIINAKQTKNMIENGRFALIIDLREYDEYIRGHLQGAINIPTNEILYRINEISSYSRNPVLLYCEHGLKSVSAGKALILNGFRSVYSLDKGIEKYRYPLYR